jgi:methylenetetrahydrofolate reductase (NADPH)
MRPGTLGICASIKHKYDRYCTSCTLVALQRRNRISMVDCHYLGINNVMALRGDAMKDEQSFVPKGVITLP